LSAFYGTTTMIAMVAFVVMSIAIASPQFSRFSLEDSAFFPAYILFAASVIAHEFGHASACARYGARVSDIGFAMYLIYPAFYSDVTAAWQLSRWRRIVIDLGGAYFQFIVMGVYLLAYAWTGWPPLQLACVLIVYTLAFSLNPVLKFDGYWVVTDLLGVANLDKQPARIRAYAYDSLRGRPRKPLPWSGGLLVIMVVYSALSFAIWTYFVVRLIPVVWFRLLRYDQSLSRLTSPIVAGHLPSWTAVHAVLVSTLLLIFSFAMLWRFGRMLVPPVVQRIRHAFRTAVPSVRTSCE
jgi:putative peptide zinc metalloprotease protein